MEYAQAPAKTIESIPRRPEGILDIMGPRTLDGGYSPSHDMSSAMASWVLDAVMNAARGAIGAKAVMTDTIRERMTKESLDMTCACMY